MIEENSEIILNIISDFLGTPKKSYENKGQYGFNCKECDDGRNKGNLEVNIYQGVWKCWSCSEINDTHGTIQKLVKRYGNKKQ